MERSTARTGREFWTRLMSDWEAFGFGVANDVAVHVLHGLTCNLRCSSLSFGGGS